MNLGPGKAQSSMQTHGLCGNHVHSLHQQSVWPAAGRHTWPSGKTLFGNRLEGPVRPQLQAGLLSEFSNIDRHSAFSGARWPDSLPRSTSAESESHAGAQSSGWKLSSENCGSVKGGTWEIWAWHQYQTSKVAFCFIEDFLSPGVSARNLDSLVFLRACICVLVWWHGEAAVGNSSWAKNSLCLVAWLFRGIVPEVMAPFCVLHAFWGGRV